MRILDSISYFPFLLIPRRQIRLINPLSIQNIPIGSDLTSLLIIYQGYSSLEELISFTIFCNDDTTTTLSSASINSNPATLPSSTQTHICFLFYPLLPYSTIYYFSIYRSPITTFVFLPSYVAHCSVAACHSRLRYPRYQDSYSYKDFFSKHVYTNDLTDIIIPRGREDIEINISSFFYL